MASAKRVKRVTMYKTSDSALAGKAAVLERLRTRDLISIRQNGTISAYPGAVEAPLEKDEREVVYKLLGYELTDPETPLIAKRSGVVGGRAAVAGTRTPVWQIVAAVQSGVSQAELRMQMGLSDEQMRQAIGYFERNRDEIRRDLFDNGVRLRAAGGAAA